MSKKQYAIMGLGKFGESIARRLCEAGQDVLGVDVDEEIVEDVEMFLTQAIIADSTDENAILALEIHRFDYVIVAIGDIQSSILTVMLLKNLGVKKIIAKAIEKRHGQVLETIGVSWVIYPERDMGLRVANHLLSPNMLNYIELSKKLNLEEIKLPNKMIGKNLLELDLRAKHHVSVIAILRDDDIITPPFSHVLLQKGDILVATGERKYLTRFSNLYS